MQGIQAYTLHGAAMSHLHLPPKGRTRHMDVLAPYHASDDADDDSIGKAVSLREVSNAVCHLCWWLMASSINDFNFQASAGIIGA